MAASKCCQCNGVKDLRPNAFVVPARNESGHALRAFLGKREAVGILLAPAIGLPSPLLLF